MKKIKELEERLNSIVFFRETDFPFHFANTKIEQIELSGDGNNVDVANTSLYAMKACDDGANVNFNNCPSATCFNGNDDLEEMEDAAD